MTARKVSGKCNVKNLSRFIIARLFEGENPIEFVAAGDACVKLFQGCIDVLRTIPGVEIELDLKAEYERATIPKPTLRVKITRNENTD